MANVSILSDGHHQTSKDMRRGASGVIIFGASASALSLCSYCSAPLRFMWFLEHSSLERRFACNDESERCPTCFSPTSNMPQIKFQGRWGGQPNLIERVWSLYSAARLAEFGHLYIKTLKSLCLAPGKLLCRYFRRKTVLEANGGDDLW